ncbi:nudC domain-containing protein 1 [Biomphalaria pfeifferi]|uniref:NudC domain-containing protein 1 n=1 Tax=Biomphalaria pfeifferi TaxID=112525 RepID=A0AAD8FFP7_BIOPF|nr:nudC domain-containing protein 1 [Biomphalaria pfeifferi]
MSSLVDLYVKRELVNSNFDHYQLSLESIPVYETPLDKHIDVAKPSENNFSSHHAKLFSIHNHVFTDPWDDSTIYFCDKEWNIGSISFGKVGKPINCDSHFQVPDSSNLRLKPSRFNVTLMFPSQTLAVIVNGADTIYLLETGERHSLNKWKIFFKEPVHVAGQAGVLLDSVQWIDGENRRLECLLASVEEVEGEVKEKHRSPWITVLSWITWISVDGKQWNVERTRSLEGSRPIDYASLDRQGQAVNIMAADVYRMTEDSVKPIDVGESLEDTAGQDESKSFYTWSQTESDMSVHLTIPDGLTKANLNIDISGTRLEVSVKNGIEMVKGNLHARVQVDACTWTLDGRRLEIFLQKVEESLWPTVIVGDSRGELVMSPELIDTIHARLAHLTSEDWNPNPDGKEKPYNSQMLEECDALDEEGTIIMRIDGELHQITHKIIANNQFLFSTILTPDKAPAICLRHDVDGFLWQLSNTVLPAKSPWEHVGVLNAFGYVLASKQQKRFSSCSPDMSVAAIADSQRHIYLYKQEVSVLTPLRNRKTGQQIKSVAKQQVLSLDASPDVILGIKLTNSKMFIATEQKILVYVMKTDE